MTVAHRSFRFALFLVGALAVLGCESKSEKPNETSKPPPAADDNNTTGKTPPKQSVASLDAAAIGQAAGTKATTTDDGVVRIGWGRDDVSVRVDGMAFPPAAGLGSWAAFAPAQGGAMVMGDSVVFQDEITPAIDAAFAAGLDVTALHNHFVFDDPPVFFMHIGGHGDAEKLAAGVKSMWDAIKSVRAAHKKPATTFGAPAVKPGKIDSKALATIIGHPAAEKPGAVKFVIERRAAMHGVDFGGSMGLATWAAFAGDDELASIDGDFAMQASEVQRVLRALRAADINIVALHNHMIGDEPAYLFVHFWGKGPAAKLAQGFRSALDAQAK